ncbi:MAG: DUF4304 domain-containing protein [Phycisphaerales bacterium]|nr:DUF4304 domain-containing protein [Phycisphaerales bacterium]MCI0631687.1 DUF4304 domain-containing protein [Phycisphaerales bacterium]MCI0674765.1 DUF4304 domain-containing protein [Phycisphaerales bacterium]
MYQVINVQMSQWGTANSGEFTINLSVVWPWFHERFTGSSMPRNPASGKCVIYQRIGFVMPEKRDYWWPVRSVTNPDELATEISRVIEGHALPFLDTYQPSDKLVRLLARGVSLPPAGTAPEILKAAAMLHVGNRRSAAAVFRRFLQNNAGADFDETMQPIVERFGLSELI